MTAPARLETAAAYRVIGAPMKRKEDFRLLTGRGKYADRTEADDALAS